MVSRIVRPLFGALVLHVFFSLGLAQAQAPAPEAVTAARELVETIHSERSI